MMIISARHHHGPARLAKARRPVSVTEIEALAAKLEPGLARAILQALQAQHASISLEALSAALQTGDIAKVMQLLSIQAFDAKMGPVQDGLQATAASAGLATAEAIATRFSGVTFRFNQLNPRLITWLQGYSYRLITQINDATREAVRQQLVTGMQAGRNPRDVARQVKQAVGLTDRQARAVANFRRELETFHERRSAGAWNLGAKISRAPGGAQVYAIDADGNPIDQILERRLRDFRYDASLKRSMVTGKPLTKEQIDKMVEAYARKYRKLRAETIARTEAMRATNVGAQESWRQAIDQGQVPRDLVRRKWILGSGDRTCPICRPVPKMNPKHGVRMDQPFRTPVGAQMLPPMHPDCRCTIFVRVIEPAQLAEEAEAA